MDFEKIEDEERDQYPIAPFLSFARAQSTAKAERDAGIGDAVHLWNGRCYAALVVDEGGAWDAPTVDVYAFTLDGGLGHANCPHDESKAKDHTWHWPCGGH